MGDYSDYTEASKLTLGDLLIRYKAENKHKRKKDWQNEEYKIKYILNDTISDTNCLKLSIKHLTEFRERRLMTVGGSTFNKDLSFISSVIQVAINDWITDKEYPMDFRNQFPTWIEDVDKYIDLCNHLAEQKKPSFELEEDTDRMKAYRYSWGVGFAEGVESVLEKVKSIKADQQKLDDAKVNQLSNNKVHKYLEEQEPDIKISKQEVLEASMLTREELIEAGIEDLDRYMKKKEEEPIWNVDFNEWWNENYDKDQTEPGKLTYQDLDRYNYITYGTHLGDKFSVFDEFIKNYCFSRKRVGFWQTDKHGRMTFFFDVKNQEELDAVNKEFEIQRAKKLLEDEGIIEKVQITKQESSFLQN